VNRSGEGVGGTLRDEPTTPSTDPSTLATQFDTQTANLTQLVTELAECEVAVLEWRMQGYINSPEESNAARERDADIHAKEWIVERYRVRARMEVARLERETTMALLNLTGDTP
jgi:hypothetical protein